MVKIKYQMHGEPVRELDVYKQGSNLGIILSAESHEDLERKLVDVGNLNNAKIWIQDEQVNYRDLLKTLDLKQ